MLFQPSAGDHDFLLYDEHTGKDVALVRGTHDDARMHAQLFCAARSMRDALNEIALCSKVGSPQYKIAQSTLEQCGFRVEYSA